MHIHICTYACIHTHRHACITHTHVDENKYNVEVERALLGKRNGLSKKREYGGGGASATEKNGVNMGKIHGKHEWDIYRIQQVL